MVSDDSSADIGECGETPSVDEVLTHLSPCHFPLSLAPASGAPWVYPSYEALNGSHRILSFDDASIELFFRPRSLRAERLVAGPTYFSPAIG